MTLTALAFLALVLIHGMIFSVREESPLRERLGDDPLGRLWRSPYVRDLLATFVFSQALTWLVLNHLPWPSVAFVQSEGVTALIAMLVLYGLALWVGGIWLHVRPSQTVSAALARFSLTVQWAHYGLIVLWIALPACLVLATWLA